MRRLIAVFLLIIVSATMSAAESNTGKIDILSYWNFNDPAGTRAAFERVLAHDIPAPDTAMRLEIMTQIARTYGLEGKFDTAQAILDDVAGHDLTGMPRVRMRHLLEQGRTFRSSGDPGRARPLFSEAWEIGREHGFDYLAIDAAHMVALVCETASERREWSMRGLALAEGSADLRCRHWIGSIGNNLGWDYHDSGEYDTALVWFNRALDIRIEEGKATETDFARWCVGRCLRSLGRFDEALAIQTGLREKHAKDSTPDGYVFEELGELHLAKGDSAAAAGSFAEAHRLLVQDSWLVKNEPARLERIAQLGRVKE